MSSTTPDYGQHEGETTANWLRRLISIGAPESIRGNVQQILASEQAPGKPPPFSALFLLIIDFIFLFICLISHLFRLIIPISSSLLVQLGFGFPICLK